MKLVEIKNISKIYHTNKNEILALKDISFDINDGDFIAIVGPSGCGKSTILSILCDLENKSGGSIIKEDNLKFGFMFQRDTLFDWMTIKDNCLLGAKINKCINEDTIKYCDELLKSYGLYEFKNSYPRELSGGMRQRVALIRTLALKPDILLLDEAMSALDYQSRLAISDDIYRIIKNEGITAIMVTHDIAEAISMSDRIIVLTKRPGKIKKIYTVELTDKSTPINNRKCKEFSKYYDELWRDLDVNI
jgi:NitT/TauT family transport system ATP-binding protein